MTEQSLSGTYISIRIDKAAGLGVIIAALEVIQPRLRIEIVPTIPEGVQVAHVVGACDLITIGVLHRQRIAPAVIDVPHPDNSVSEIQRFYILVQISV